MGKPREPMQHLSLHLQGLVQGVGLRPHVVRLAAMHRLNGTVANSSSGVQLELEGSQAALETFVTQLLNQPPERARIDRHRMSWGPPHGMPSGVQILPSRSDGSNTALVSPDLAICEECLREMSDPANRRCGYPFISCTNCGPRYSVLEQMPFERENTSLKAMPLCPDCQCEYHDPHNRRFHAQTISCSACGPQLFWDGAPLSHAAALKTAADALKKGAILALQGVGGFQLLVDPTNSEAILRLRHRKGRPDKPLAMLASQTWLEQNCRISAEERSLWSSSAAPILLVSRNTEREVAPIAAISTAVTRTSHWLGVMRPCSGLHQLLLARCGGLLVATSANRSGEPICSDAIADAAVLATLADHVLSHNLPIVNRIDDSVMRWAAGGPLVLRLGRGLAPLALPNADGLETSGALAMGAQMKGSMALQTPSHRLLSPDLGDLSNVAGAQHQQRTCLQWLQRHDVTVNRVLCDQHPGYISSQWARDLANAADLPLQAVQHHHAHLLAVMAEHRISGSALGVAWDGSGQGDDGTLWGGEALAINAHHYQRIARLRPWPLPGGEAAQREPRRSALGLLTAGFGAQWRERIHAVPALAWSKAFSAEDLSVLEQSIARELNSPLCSSIGRLFDAVAALLNLVQLCSFEAQAAMALEGLAWQAKEQPQLPGCGLQLPLEAQANGSWQWNWEPLLEKLLHALAEDVPTSAIALGFHCALAEAIATLAKKESATRLLLAGGCFQNGLLLELTVSALAQLGCQALWPQQLSCNDAALPIGQLLAAETMPINEISPQAIRYVPGRRR